MMTLRAQTGLLTHCAEIGLGVGTLQAESDAACATSRADGLRDTRVQTARPKRWVYEEIQGELSWKISFTYCTGRFRRELEARKQYTDECFIEHVITTQEVYSLAHLNASHEEQVQRVMKQVNPTIAAYFGSSQFRNSHEPALDAKRSDSDMLQSRACRPLQPI